MIPRKLIELLFRRAWILLIPVLVVPLAATFLMKGATEYESSATVWVASPPAGTTALGHYNVYLSPAQNHSAALNDLLATESFRAQVLDRARAAAGEGTFPEGFVAGSVSGFTSGVNLLVIRTRAATAEEAAALATGTVEEFRERNAEFAERTAQLSAEYYEQQLGVAQAALAERLAALNTYLAANPGAAEPGSPASVHIDHQTLRTRVQQQEAVVEELTQLLQQVQLSRVGAPQGQEVAFAVQDPPETPIAPVPLSMTERFGVPLAGVVLGMLISATYLYVVYRTDHTIRSSEDVAPLGVSLLGQVPELRQSRIAAWKGRLLRRRQPDFARHMAANGIFAESRRGRGA